MILRCVIPEEYFENKDEPFVMKKENSMISIAKGIGIVLVLVGHFIFVPEIRRFIYCFHMPLFFFLSGFLFKDKVSAKEYPLYIWRKFKRLYLPFVLCNLIVLPFHNLLCDVGVYETTEVFSSFKEVAVYTIKIFFCVKMEDIVAQLWFLPILMTVSILYYFLRLILEKTKNKETVTFVVALLGYIIAFWLVYSGRKTGICRAIILVGLGFWIYNLGHIYQINEKVVKRYSHNKVVILCCIVAEILFSFIVDINMIQMRYSNPIYFTVCSILGINIILFVAEVIGNKKDIGCRILRYLGNNSLVVLEWHYCGALVTTVIQCAIYGCQIEGIIFYHGYTKLIWFFMYCVTGFGLPLVVLWIRRKLQKRTRQKYRIVKTVEN